MTEKFNPFSSQLVSGTNCDCSEILVVPCNPKQAGNLRYEPFPTKAVCAHLAAGDVRCKALSTGVLQGFSGRGSARE